MVYAKIPFGEEDHTRKITVKVPYPVGTESTLCMDSTPSKGMGGDRFAKKHIRWCKWQDGGREQDKG